MRHYYNKNRKNLLIICPILNLQGCKRNKLRNYEKYVPKIAYSVYTKNYEEPNENEGFKLFII